jgi:hypothetical protein
MDKVQKLISKECYTPSSEPFRMYNTQNHRTLGFVRCTVSRKTAERNVSENWTCFHSQVMNKVQRHSDSEKPSCFMGAFGSVTCSQVRVIGPRRNGVHAQQSLHFYNHFQSALPSALTSPVSVCANWVQLTCALWILYTGFDITNY